MPRDDDSPLTTRQRWHALLQARGYRPATPAPTSGFTPRILCKYGYPPDKQERATQTVLEQAEITGPSSHRTLYYSQFLHKDIAR